MKFDFNELNFETLDANMNVSLDITINPNGVTFSKRVVEQLRYPAQILCQFDAKNKVLAIRMCRADEQRAFKFSKPKEEQKTTVTITNKNLVDPIRKVMQGAWAPGKRYRVTGFWVADAKTICFDLTEAELVDSRTRSKDSDNE